MPVLPFLIAVLCIFAIAYRYYSAFIAAKVLALDPKRKTPAHTHYDGHNYYPTNRWVLFGHHFAAISGAGPLIGPVLAAQFGFLPGFLWLLIGVVLGGAVHDFVLLTASTRSGGKSIAEIAKKEIGPVAGAITIIAILFIVVIALAGLGLAEVNALHESAWGCFTVAVSIPLAVGMGLYIYKFKNGSDRAIKQASAVGVALLLLSVIFGKAVAESSWGGIFSLSRNQIIFGIATYGFIASILPVWILLCPRDYLSSYLKLGTIAILVLAVFLVRPDLKMPPITKWVAGGGPIIPGKLFPYVFITIACGAISGFHGLVASGTTPKMLKNELDARPIGYGGMLLEGLVGIVALIATASLYPEDYFAINLSVERFGALGMSTVNLPALEAAVGEKVTGRAGGAVSLAVGIAQIFSALPLMEKLMSYWYHFAIMFEAMFVLTTIDTGTRVARFLVQDALGSLSPRFAKTDWLPGAIVASVIVVFGWTFFILTGSIGLIWPIFGVANQLLACVGLCVATTWLINHGKKKYAWVTAAPLAFVATTTICAGVLNIKDQYLKMMGKPDTAAQGLLLASMTVIMMACVGLIFGSAVPKWLRKR